jgi:hypothetical protein
MVENANREIGVPRGLERAPRIAWTILWAVERIIRLCKRQILSAGDGSDLYKFYPSVHGQAFFLTNLNSL